MQQTSESTRFIGHASEPEAVAGLGASTLARDPDASAPGHEIRADLPFHDAKEIWNELFERSYLTRLLASNRGNVSATARDAGIDRRHLQRLMIKHGLRGRDTNGRVDRGAELAVAR